MNNSVEGADTLNEVIKEESSITGKKVKTTSFNSLNYRTELLLVRIFLIIFFVFC
jgi:hypothetical protein